MKESVANSYVFSIIIVIVGVCSALMIISMNYSKVFKMKNRVVSILEKHGTYDDSRIRDEIDTFLKNAGYPPTQNPKCPTRPGSAVGGTKPEDVGLVAINKPRSHRYCIYRFATAKGTYYSVVLYMRFEFPIIGDFIRLELPVSGSTKIIFDY